MIPAALGFVPVAVPLPAIAALPCPITAPEQRMRKLNWKPFQQPSSYG